MTTCSAQGMKIKIICDNCGRTDSMPLPLTETREVNSPMLSAVIAERDWAVNLPGLDHVDGIRYSRRPFAIVKLCPDCQRSPQELRERP